MGASGAGKTTLLNAVAGEAAGGRLSGQVLVNGGSVDSETMRKLRAFVFQVPSQRPPAPRLRALCSAAKRCEARTAEGRRIERPLTARAGAEPAGRRDAGHHDGA